MKLKVIGENLGSYLNAIALDVRKSSWKMEYRKLIVSQPSEQKEAKISQSLQRIKGGQIVTEFLNSQKLSRNKRLGI